MLRANKIVERCQMSRELNLNLNPGYEMMKCCSKADISYENKINKLTDSMNVTNLQIKVMSDVMNKLAHAKQKDKKIDFSRQDETTKKYAYFVHLQNPTILGDKIHNLPVQDGNLQETLTKIIEQMIQEGIPDDEIELGAILERFNYDHNIRFEVFDESGIDILFQGLEAELGSLKSSLNQGLMHVASKNEERQNLFKSGHDTGKESGELNKSIIGKTVR